jgi:hypothetical protein
VAGLVFDADFYFEPTPNKADANNDLIRDDGFAPDGDNWLGEGISQFYALVRSRLPDKYILTGTAESRGFAATNGTQMESWLDYGSGAFDEFGGDPEYPHLNSLFSIYLFNMSHASDDQPLVHNLTKTATRAFPGRVNPPPEDNRPARLGIALTLMDDGYYGTHSRYTPDAWWDEYAVDVTPGSATYGEAISMFDAAGVRAHRGWLGQPLGEFVRLYDAEAFAPDRSLLADGDFESGLGEWTGRGVSVGLTAQAFEGNGALHAGAMNPVTEALTAAQIKGPRLALKAGTEYTISFEAKASAVRSIRVDLGTFGDRFILGTEWRRYVMAFRQDVTETVPLLISVGREDVPVSIDDVYLFEGNANVFRRDFEHGIALANATPSSRTIDLGGTFRRIKGTQDPDVNDGATVTSVTLSPYDGLLLVRPE